MTRITGAMGRVGTRPPSLLEELTEPPQTYIRCMVCKAEPRDTTAWWFLSTDGRLRGLCPKHAPDHVITIGMGADVEVEEIDPAETLVKITEALRGDS